MKVVYPQSNIDLKDYEKLDFDHFYLQPLDNKNIIVLFNAFIQNDRVSFSQNIYQK